VRQVSKKRWLESNQQASLPLQKVKKGGKKMTYTGYRVKVPGKLLIAGEYAVLEPNHQAIVMAVNRYMSAYIEPSKQNSMSLPQLGLETVTWKWSDNPVEFTHSDSRLGFIQNSFSVTKQFLQENSIPLQPFKLTVKSELNHYTTGKKFGFGSSASVVVAVISAMLTLHSHEHFQPTLEQIFKLSAIAHFKTQKNGSCADIAAATFGGWILYSSFDPKWLTKELRKEYKIGELIQKTWPNLKVQPIQPPANLNVCIGWTKRTSSTRAKIYQIQHFRDRNPAAYKDFLVESAKAVDRIIKSYEKDDTLEAILGLIDNRKALLSLSENTNFTIETTSLKELCTLAQKYGGGKSSGAGGGDCGIAFMAGTEHTEDLYHSWQQAGIVPLRYVSVSSIGAEVTEYNCEPSLKIYLSS
jgi:phosphomevalonate kinase